MNKSLTQYLKDIGEEKVKIVINGKIKKVSRTEALARRLYVMAMGGIEEIVVDGDIVKKVHKADHRVAKDIREYTEGKAAVEPAKEKKKQIKAGEYSSEIGRRLNERLGGGNKAESGVPEGEIE